MTGSDILTRAESFLHHLEVQEIFFTGGYEKFIFLRFYGIDSGKINRKRKKMPTLRIELPYREKFWPSLVFVESTLHTRKDELVLFCTQRHVKQRVMQKFGELIQTIERKPSEVAHLFNWDLCPSVKLDIPREQKPSPSLETIYRHQCIRDATSQDRFETEDGSPEDSSIQTDRCPGVSFAEHASQGSSVTVSTNMTRKPRDQKSLATPSSRFSGSSMPTINGSSSSNLTKRSTEPSDSSAQTFTGRGRKRLKGGKLSMTVK